MLGTGGGLVGGRGGDGDGPPRLIGPGDPPVDQLAGQLSQREARVAEEEADVAADVGQQVGAAVGQMLLHHLHPVSDPYWDADLGSGAVRVGRRRLLVDEDGVLGDGALVVAEVVARLGHGVQPGHVEAVQLQGATEGQLGRYGRLWTQHVGAGDDGHPELIIGWNLMWLRLWTLYSGQIPNVHLELR